MEVYQPHGQSLQVGWGGKDNYNETMNQNEERAQYPPEETGRGRILNGFFKY